MRLLGGKQVRWAAVVQLGALLGCLLLSVLVYRYFEVCDRESGGALAEFPMFENAAIEPEPEVNAEDCYATFSTTAPADSVISYYRQQLTSHGWRVRAVTREQVEGYVGVPLPEGQEVHELWGERGNLCYSVSIGPPLASTGSSSVVLFVKYVLPGEMLHPPHRC